MLLEAAILCLTLNLYHEARGEPLDGILAVAAVTLNRVETKGFPNTICEVVHEVKVKGKPQFTWTKFNKKVKDKKSFNKLKVLATKILAKKVSLVRYKDYLYYNSSPFKWKKSKPYKIGHHYFYK